MTRDTAHRVITPERFAVIEESFARVDDLEEWKDRLLAAADGGGAESVGSVLAAFVREFGPSRRKEDF